MNSIDGTAESNPNQCLPEWQWKNLLRGVEDGTLIPILGSELLVVKGNDGKQENLYDIWGRRMIEQMNIPIVLHPGTPALYQVSNYLLTHPVAGAETTDGIASVIDSIIDSDAWAIPRPLLQLASLKSLPLLVSTTIDHLLVQALRQVTPDSPDAVAELPFVPRANKDKLDFPKKITPRSKKRLAYCLFGNTNSSRFAATEDDLIEFSWSLLDNAYAPANFYDYLTGKIVLLLGCSFPDWLGRFFVHAIHAKRNIKFYYISQRNEPGLTEFLRRRQANALTPYDPVAFVDELHKRWFAAHPEETTEEKKSSTVPASAPVPEMKSGSVFIS
jgi:hypothetical protein